MGSGMVSSFMGFSFSSKFILMTMFFFFFFYLVVTWVVHELLKEKNLISLCPTQTAIISTLLKEVWLIYINMYNIILLN